MTPQYRAVADDLRARLAAGEWEIGERIPGISELQERYRIRSLSTIRQAQQILVQEGLLRTEQGRGAFVVAHHKPAADDANMVVAASGRRSAVLDETIATTSSDGAIHLSVPPGSVVTVQTQAEYCAPRGVIQSMVELLLGTPSDPEGSIVDPAAGSGGFLVEAFRYLQAQRVTHDNSDSHEEEEARVDPWRQMEDHLIQQAARAEVREALADKIAERLGCAS